MNNYLNNSYNYNNHTNIKLIPKTKSINNFNQNTFKILRNANQINNTNSKPIKIKNNNHEKIIEEQKKERKPKTPEQDKYLNEMIQEYNYFQNLYQNNKNINFVKLNKKNRYRLSLKRPSTAPQNNKNKKERINKHNDINNIHYNNNNANEQLYKLYYSENNDKKSLQSELIKKPKRNIGNMNMYNKLFRPVGYRPPSPMIEPHLRLNKY